MFGLGLGLGLEAVVRNGGQWNKYFPTVANCAKMTDTVLEQLVFLYVT